MKHSGTSVIGNFVELDTFLWNTIGTDTSAFSVAKFDSSPRGRVHKDSCNF